MSYNITFTTPLKLNFVEKWLFPVPNLAANVKDFNNASSLRYKFSVFFQALNFDTLPYYGINNLNFHEAK